MSRRVGTATKPYRHDDWEAFDSVVTTRHPETQELLTCTKPDAVTGEVCGELVEILHQDLVAFWKDRVPPHCAECRGDRRVLELLHPSPKQVERLREMRAAGETPPEYRRRNVA